MDMESLTALARLVAYLLMAAAQLITFAVAVRRWRKKE